MDESKGEELLRKIMDVERRFSSGKKNLRSERKAELKQLIDRYAVEGETNAPTEG